MREDIDFLLNLVDSQVRPDCFPDMIAVNKEYAATLMRSACIEAVRSLRHKSESDDSRWNAALYHAETKLEGVTIQEQEKQS